MQDIYKNKHMRIYNRNDDNEIIQVIDITQPQIQIGDHVKLINIHEKEITSYYCPQKILQDPNEKWGTIKDEDGSPNDFIVIMDCDNTAYQISGFNLVGKNANIITITRYKCKICKEFIECDICDKDKKICDSCNTSN
jgi:hypothetical protein